MFGAARRRRLAEVDCSPRPPGAFGGAALTAQLESQTGINLERDIFSWIGDIAVYAHGDGPDDHSTAR